jgi:hypothetical protein
MKVKKKIQSSLTFSTIYGKTQISKKIKKKSEESGYESKKKFKHPSHFFTIYARTKIEKSCKIPKKLLKFGY